MGYEEIEHIALRDVYLDKLKLPGVSSDFHLRRIFREYSKKFHTPLHVVYDLPLEFVFQAWLEEFYEDQKEDSLRAEAIVATKDPTKLVEERRAEDAQDAEDHLFIEEERKLQETMKKMEEVLAVAKKFSGPIIPRDRDSELVMAPAPRPAADQITMKFEEVDFDADSFCPFEPPEPK